LSLEIRSEIAWIADFVLSCRVMGRNVESAMVAFVAQYCAALGLQELRADYFPTAKNKPCFRFWMSSGFSYDKEKNRFLWFLREPYQFPRGIEVRLQSLPVST
jgi:predicted enzyme involved in methoxymalonyl-ACP biosynthesis